MEEGCGILKRYLCIHRADLAKGVGSKFKLSICCKRWRKTTQNEVPRPSFFFLQIEYNMGLGRHRIGCLPVGDQPNNFFMCSGEHTRLAGPSRQRMNPVRICMRASSESGVWCPVLQVLPLLAVFLPTQLPPHLMSYTHIGALIAI